MKQRDDRVTGASASVIVEPSLARMLLPAGLVAAWFAAVVGVAVALGRGEDAAGAVVPFLGIAVYCGWVLRRGRRAVLVLDQVGVRGRGGVGIAWRDAALIWIGYEGALGSPMIRIWDQPSLTFSARSGARPEERFRCWVTAAITADQLTVTVRGFTTVPIRPARTPTIGGFSRNSEASTRPMTLPPVSMTCRGVRARHDKAAGSP